MSTKSSLIFLAAFVVAVLIILGETSSHGAQSAFVLPGTCSVATIRGGYGNKFSNLFADPATTSLPAKLNAFTPLVGSLLAQFDGDGNLSESGTVSVGGLILKLTVTGTYTVNPDCTGTLTATDNFGGTFHLNLTIVDDGREIQGIQTDPGNVNINILKKQF